VSFEYRTSSAGIIVPNTDSHVSRTRSDQSSALITRNISDWTLMAGEFVGPGIRSEAPRPNSAIVGTRNNLLKTRVEDSFTDFVSVSRQSFKQGGISGRISLC
jgi:hypothetical protein